MEQKIPNITQGDIERIVGRDFPQFEFAEVEAILKKYKYETDQGKNRVYASVLKLSNGNIELVRKNIEKANIDYRDLIALAEYPNYSKYAFEDNLSKEKRQLLISDDWTQYESWFSRE